VNGCSGRRPSAYSSVDPWGAAAPPSLRAAAHPVKPCITAETDRRLSRYFGASQAFWMNLQAHYGLELQKDPLGIASHGRSRHWRKRGNGLEGIFPDTP
jgi:hypothetical protein